MSEPHELEERTAKLAAAEQPECQFCNFAECDAESCYCRKSARAVLNLVRQEQEKALTMDMRAAGVNAPLPMKVGNPPIYESVWFSMIRAWWLSHTAP